MENIHIKNYFSRWQQIHNKRPHSKFQCGSSKNKDYGVDAAGPSKYSTLRILWTPISF